MSVDDIVDVGEVAEAGKVEGLSAEGLLLMAAENLKRSMHACVSALTSFLIAMTRFEMNLLTETLTNRCILPLPYLFYTDY